MPGVGSGAPSGGRALSESFQWPTSILHYIVLHMIRRYAVFCMMEGEEGQGSSTEPRLPLAVAGPACCAAGVLAAISGYDRAARWSPSISPTRLSIWADDVWSCLSPHG